MLGREQRLVLCIFGVVLVCLHTFAVVKTSPTSRKISISFQRTLKRNKTKLATALNLTQAFADAPKRTTSKGRRFKNRSTLSLASGLSLVNAPPTNTREVKLFSKNGYLLQISSDGFVNGTLNVTSPYVWFELQIIRVGVVRIKSKATGRYLAMDKYGRLRGRVRLSLETLFVTKVVNSYHWYRSYRYSSWYVAIRKNGTKKPGHQTAADQKAVLFFILTK